MGKNLSEESNAAALPAAEETAEPPAGQVFYSLPTHPVILTWLILGINIAIWLLMTINGGSETTEVLIHFGAKVNGLIVAGEYWRLVSPIFLHIGILHLAFNSYALAAFGPAVERYLGAFRFFLIYLFSGVLGVIASFAFNDHLSAGASGAIFGLIGTLVVFFYVYRDKTGSGRNNQLYNVLTVAGYNLIYGFVSRNIDNFGHIGGLLGGLLIGALLVPRYQLYLNQYEDWVVVVDRVTQRRQWLVLAGGVAALVLLANLAVNERANSPSVLLEQAQQHLSMEEYAAALPLLQRVVAAEPQSVEGQFYLAMAYTGLGRYPQAAATYEALLKQSPRLAEAHWNLARLYVLMGEKAKARAELERFLQLNPTPSQRLQAEALLTQLK